MASWSHIIVQRTAINLHLKKILIKYKKKSYYVKTSNPCDLVRNIRRQIKDSNSIFWALQNPNLDGWKMGWWCWLPLMTQKRYKL